MRTTLVLILALAALLVVGQAAAAKTAAPRLVTVVMHDPGCHWFSVGGKLKTTLAVKGPVALFNVDEAALKVQGPKGVQIDKVGKKLVLQKGVYRITMVGQAPDDNHLKLTVS